MAKKTKEPSTIVEDFENLSPEDQVSAYSQIKKLMEEKQKDAEAYLNSLKEVNK